MSIICAKHCISLFQRSVDSLNLLRGFWQLDEVARQDDLQTLQRTIDSWYYGFGSPAVAGILETVEDYTGGTTLDSSMHWLIREQIADLIRISFTGPSSDIRSFAKELLLDLKTKKGFCIPHIQIQSPSFIISLQEMPHLDCFKEDPVEGEHLFTTYALFREHWFQWGRLENYVCVMGFHPEYLECFMKLQAHLFRADLPIPYPDRHYLAIMAAAEQRCIYLVLLFARQFLSSGGDPSWLQGLHQGPLKWRQLAGLNSDLCGRPWKITADQIYNLTHGGDKQSSKETLSLSELMHAVAIMTHVHALACFVFGCRIRPEIDQLDVLYSVTEPSDHTNGVGQAGLHASGDDARLDVDGRRRLIANDHPCPCPNCSSVSKGESSPLKPTESSLLSASSTSENSPTTQLLQRIQDECSDLENLDEDVVVEEFTKVIHLNDLLDSAQPPPTIIKAHEYKNKLNEHIAIIRFIQTPESGYQNFDDQPLLVAEYCWQEEGRALSDRLCTDLGTLLDEKFRNAYDLTYNTLNDITGVDTSLYRRTVWNLIQSLFGMCHDDFRYGCIDRLMSVEQRIFLKNCVTRPYNLSDDKVRFVTTFPVLSTPEVVHLIIMAVEARHQACLLYALRAISECQTLVRR